MKNKSFVKCFSLILIAITLVLTGVLSIVNNNTNNVVSADIQDLNYTYTSSNFYMPIRFTVFNGPSDYDFDDFFVNSIISFNRDNDYLYFSLNFNYYENNVYSSGLTGNCNVSLSSSSLSGYNTIYFNSSIYSFTFFVKLSNADFNCNVVKIVFTSDIIDGLFYNHIIYYDNNSNTLDFYYIVNDNFSRFNYKVYLLTSDLTDSEYYNNGYDVGYNVGISAGYNNGYSAGSESGYNNGYSVGYQDGVIESNDYSFFSLIGAVLDGPVTVITSLFNFEVLGTNLLGFITALLTLAIVIFIVRLALVK